MGTLDRPASHPDKPDELGAALDAQPTEPVVWPNLDGQSNEAAAAFLGLERQDRRLPDLTGKATSLSEAGVRGGLPRWKVTDPIELPELVVRTDIKPGKDPLDYRNPEVSDLRTFGRGDVVIVGKKDSAEDPRRLAEVQVDGRLVDKDADGSPPENPSGEDLLVPRDEGKSRRERLLNETANQKFIEGLDDTGKNFGNKTLDFLKDRPQVTGAHAVVPCQPIARETPPSVNQPGGGVDAILGATCAALAVVKMTVESRRSKSKAPAQAEGDRTDGDY